MPAPSPNILKLKKKKVPVIVCTYDVYDDMYVWFQEALRYFCYAIFYRDAQGIVITRTYLKKLLVVPPLFWIVKPKGVVGGGERKGVFETFGHLVKLVFSRFLTFVD